MSPTRGIPRRFSAMSDLLIFREVQNGYWFRKQWVNRGQKNILSFGEFLSLTDGPYLASSPNSAGVTVRLGMAPSLFLIEDFME